MSEFVMLTRAFAALLAILRNVIAIVFKSAGKGISDKDKAKIKSMISTEVASQVDQLRHAIDQAAYENVLTAFSRAEKAKSQSPLLLIAANDARKLGLQRKNLNYSHGEVVACLAMSVLCYQLAGEDEMSREEAGELRDCIDRYIQAQHEAPPAAESAAADDKPDKTKAWVNTTDKTLVLSNKLCTLTREVASLEGERSVPG